jgi:hypothetical protein
MKKLENWFEFRWFFFNTPVIHLNKKIRKGRWNWKICNYDVYTCSNENIKNGISNSYGNEGGEQNEKKTVKKGLKKDGYEWIYLTTYDNAFKNVPLVEHISPIRNKEVPFDRVQIQQLQQPKTSQALDSYINMNI